MKTAPLALAALLPALLAACATPAPAPAPYPTADRVQYVHQCMRDHPGPGYEMIAKCSCAMDHIISKVSYDDYTTFSTLSNAVTIAGERGGALRENESLKPALKVWRDLQAEAAQACFLTAP